jgi:hypothetical protein
MNDRSTFSLLPAQWPARGSAPHAGLRMTDHPGEIWEQWREEFARRFCTFSPEIAWDLGVAIGSPVDFILDQARGLQTDIIVATAGPEVRERPDVLRHVAESASCPVLVVPRGAGPAPPGECAQTDMPEKIPER